MEQLSNLLEDIRLGIINNEQLKGVITGSLIPTVQNYRQRFEMRWYLNDAYYKGDHWIGFNKNTGTIESVRLEPWRDKIIVNLVEVSVNAMEALLTNKRPAFYVSPEENDNEVVMLKDPAGNPILDPQTNAPSFQTREGTKVQEAKRASSALETISYDIGFRKKYVELVHDGLVFGNGFVKVFWDQETKEGLGEVDVARRSPYSLYIDPLCIDNVLMKDARFIIDVTQRDVTEVNMHYGVDVKADNKQSASSYENMAKNVRFGSSESTNSDTVLVYECWLRIPYKEKSQVANEDGEMVEGDDYLVKNQMVCVTMTKDKILRVAVDPTGYNDHPYVGFVYKPIPGEFYGQGLVLGVRDMNDQINRRMSQMAENATMMGNPRMVVDEGSVRPGEYTNQPGKLVRKKPGAQHQLITPANVSGDVQAIVSLLSNWFQDITQTHDVSIGRVPPNVNSGLQVELLQAADSNVLSPHFERFEDTLKAIAKKMLLTMKEKYPAGRKFTIKDSNGNIDQFDFDPTNFNFSDVRVEIDSDLAHTKAGRQNVLMELVGKGLISIQTFLESFGGFNKDVDTIMKQMRQEQDLRASGSKKQDNQPESSGQPLPQTGMPIGQSPIG